MKGENLTTSDRILNLLNVKLDLLEMILNRGIDLTNDENLILESIRQNEADLKGEIRKMS